MGSTTLLGSKSDHTAWDRAREPFARIVLAVFLDVHIERLAVWMDLTTVVDGAHKLDLGPIRSCGYHRQC